jgi:hypothetical protein
MLLDLTQTNFYKLIYKLVFLEPIFYLFLIPLIVTAFSIVLSNRYITKEVFISKQISAIFLIISLILEAISFILIVCFVPEPIFIAFGIEIARLAIIEVYLIIFASVLVVSLIFRAVSTLPSGQL